MDGMQARFFHDLSSQLFAIDAMFIQKDLGAIAARFRDFDLRGIFWHQNRGGDLELLRHISDGLRMVTGRNRKNAVLFLFIRQLEKMIECAAQLEGADGMHGFVLDHQTFETGGFGKRKRWNQWCFLNDAGTTYTPGGIENILQGKKGFNHVISRPRQLPRVQAEPACEMIHVPDFPVMRRQEYDLPAANDPDPVPAVLRREGFSRDFRLMPEIPD
jgi:hypothetical protein